ncbi:MAG: hypothetical protein WD403_07090 [Pirellulales bacterium]
MQPSTTSAGAPCADPLPASRQAELESLRRELLRRILKNEARRRSNPREG